MARKVTELCLVENIRIPDDISLLGVDNDEFMCNISSPTISSIRLNFEKHGYELEDIFVGNKGAHIEDLAKLYTGREFNWVKEWYLGVEGNPKGRNKNEKLGISGLAKAVEKQQKKVDSKKNPAQNLTDELIRLQNEYANERRRFVDHMLEIE
jgi:hypothetical protein